MQPSFSDQRLYGVSLAILVISSALFGLWSLQHTIALRNFLLAIGFLLSLIYLFYIRRKKSIRIFTISVVPLILLGIFFGWVVIHYFFLSQNPTVQIKELTSVWFRSFLGVIIGWVVGLIISRKPELIYLFIAGIIGSFIVLYVQYIPRVWSSGELFQYDFGGYIFYAKHNAVLMGSLLISIIGGLMIHFLEKKSVNFSLNLKNTLLPFSIFVVLYSYIFIFSAKNGIVVAIILNSFWLIYLLYVFFYAKKYSFLKIKREFLIYLLILIILPFFFLVAQFSHLSSWGDVVEDVTESIKFENNKNSIMIPINEYPILESGRSITPNVFERISWASSGLRLIPLQPWGGGVLSGALGEALNTQYPNQTRKNLPTSSHSGWVDLTLAFGFPFPLCIFGAIFTAVYSAIRNRSSMKIIVLSLAISLLSVFAFGELGSQHPVEILFFIIALITGLANSNNPASERFR